MANYNGQNGEFLFKVVLIGAPSVGKTSIIQRFVANKFSQDYRATIGADFRCKSVDVSNKSVLLQIWDTAGQERFRALATPFYRGANICVLVFDVSKKFTFDALEFWREEFLDHINSEDNNSLPFVIIGNKKDLGSQIAADDVNKWIQQKGHNMVYVETSAKDGSNISVAFQKAAQMCLDQYAGNSSLYVANDAEEKEDKTLNTVNLEEISQTNEEPPASLLGQCAYC